MNRLHLTMIPQFVIRMPGSKEGGGKAKGRRNDRHINDKGSTSCELLDDKESI